MRRRVLAEAPFCCECGKPATQVDHVVPLSRGGTTERENLQSLCRLCHEEKSLSDRLRADPCSTWAGAFMIAKRLGVAERTVRRWAADPRLGFPAPVGKMFNRRHWNWSEVEEWAGSRAAE